MTNGSSRPSREYPRRRAFGLRDTAFAGHPEGGARAIWAWDADPEVLEDG